MTFLIIQQFVDFNTMMDIDKPKSYKNTINGHSIKCSYIHQTVCIEVSTPNITDKIYYGSYSNDTIPQTLKMIFETAIELYDHIAETTVLGKVEIQRPDQIILVYYVGKKDRRATLPLSEKILSKEEQLARKIQKLENELSYFKNGMKHIPGGQQIQKYQLQLNQKAREIMIYQEQLSIMQKKHDDLHEEFNFFKASSEKKIQGEDHLQTLIADKQFYQRQTEILLVEKEELLHKVASLQGQIQTQNMIIDELQVDLGEQRQLLNYYTKQSEGVKVKQSIKDVEAAALIFKPNPNSTNFNFYDFKDNILTKNNNSQNSNGRLLPCANTIPMNGRHIYKIKNKLAKNKPNFRVGVVARDKIQTQAYMNGGDEDAIMFYCYQIGKQIINQGAKKFDGFNVGVGSVLKMVIDRDKLELEWYLDDILMHRSKFTKSMKQSQHLYLFVQLWTNGDQLQMIP